MKKYMPILIFALLSVSLSCHTTKNSVGSPGTITQLKDFEIDNQTAQKMIDWFTSCKDSCKDPSTSTDGLGILTKLRLANPNSRIEPTMARFKDRQDEDRYCRTRKLPGNSASCKVKNYSIELTKITAINSQGGGTPTYYSFRRICPPPPTCNPIDSLR